MVHTQTNNTITILRMEYGKVNVLDTDQLKELIKSFRKVEKSDTGAVVLTGEGSCFSAGVDLIKIVKGSQAYLKDFLPLLSEILLIIFNFPKPVVAAINGHAIAGGCIIACACDVRIMADGNGKIGAPELLVGVPLPVLPLEILRFAVPAPYFQEMVYSGQNYLPKEALERGIVDQIEDAHDLINNACLIAESLAAIPSVTFRMTKRNIRRPVLDQFEKYGNLFDGEVAEAWASQEIRETISLYLYKTLGKT